MTLVVRDRALPPPLLLSEWGWILVRGAVAGDAILAPVDPFLAVLVHHGETDDAALEVARLDDATLQLARGTLKATVPSGVRPPRWVVGHPDDPALA